MTQNKSKQKLKKLSVSKEVVRVLTSAELTLIRGGAKYERTTKTKTGS